MKMITVCTAVLILLSACSKNQTIKRVLTLQDVVQVVKNEGVKLVNIHPKGQVKSGIYEDINIVSPATYAIDQSTNSFNVNILIYIFNSEQDRIDGRKVFDIRMESAKLIVQPSDYQFNNVLIVYFRESKEKDIVNDKLNKAIHDLELAS
jgi:hypothetical protein